MTLAAAIQMVTTENLDTNLREAGALVLRAAEAGARLAVLPENFALMGRKEADKLAVAENPGSGPIQDFLAGLAARERIWLVGGTVPIKCPTDDSRVFASSLVFDPQGAQVARFDKIHLFDVSIPDPSNAQASEQYAESRSTVAGSEIVVVDTEAGRLGLAVCYDLRFPELFRKLAAQGAEIISLPSAFTAATGRAHWEVLVRARAIENLCYVIAPGQGGTHANGRQTFGDSMIVDPWGRILGRQPQGPGVVTADIDLARLHETRERFPCLLHRRLG
jgi:nitrilase